MHYESAHDEDLKLSPVFRFLSEENINSILKYIITECDKSESTVEDQINNEHLESENFNNIIK